MGLGSVLLIAIGLAMDAFAVSITSGMILQKNMVRNAIRIGAYFGLFQAMMPAFGYIAGLQFKDYIEGIDHWIAFVILAFLGGKMMLEAKKDEEKEFDSLSNKLLLILAIATSIDALAAGIGFAFLEVSIFKATLIIGIVTFFLSMIGVLVGKRFGQFFKKKAEILGGFVLVSIGVKILIEHTNIFEIIQVLN